MKILIQNPKEPILEGVSQVLHNIGETLIVWHEHLPLNDFLDTHKPDLVIGYNGMTAHKNTKLVIIKTIEHAVEHTEVQTVGNPDLTCISSEIPRPDQSEKSKTPHFIVDPAANISYNNVESDPKYATEVFYYSQNTTPEILTVLQDIEKKYQLKVIGHHKIPLTSYLGAGTATDIVKFMKSCQIALAFDMASLYTYAANKVFCVTNQDTNLFPKLKELPNLVNYDQSDQSDQSDKYDLVAITKNRIKDNIQSSHSYVLDAHTYFHRTHDILSLLGFTEQAEKCLTQLQVILNKMAK